MKAAGVLALIVSLSIVAESKVYTRCKLAKIFVKAGLDNFGGFSLGNCEIPPRLLARSTLAYENQSAWRCRPPPCPQPGQAPLHRSSKPHAHPSLRFPTVLGFSLLESWGRDHREGKEQCRHPHPSVEDSSFPREGSATRCCEISAWHPRSCTHSRVLLIFLPCAPRPHVCWKGASV